MAWPTVAVDTTGMDADTDTLPRSAILDLTTKFNELIAMRGVASGVCDLDASGVVPVARIPADIARLASPALTGNPTAPTQALRNSSTRLATTAFVLANGLLNGVLAKSAAYTLVAADYSKLVNATAGTWNLTIDPGLGAGPVCAARNSGSGVITLVPASGTIDGTASVALAAGESCLIESDGTDLVTVGRNIGIQSLAASGYKALPGGLIVQWGSTVKTATGTLAITLPLAFPSAAFLAVPVPNYTGAVNYPEVSYSLTTTTLTVNSSNFGANYYVNWVALGQ